MKCRDCEREDPLDKFKRAIRCRIYHAILKNKPTIEYLGCSSNEYIQWMNDHSLDFTIENHGKIWHIDHVIPLSKFDLMLADVESKISNARSNLKTNRTFTKRIQSSFIGFRKRTG
jgi:hypothetical protein